MTTSTPSRSQAFVDYIIQLCAESNGARAALTRADNPATEYQSWEILAGFHINLEHASERMPYCTIASALARTKTSHNGTLTFGQAIARCYQDGNKETSANAKLRRVLACDEVVELCRVLRPVLRLMESREVTLDYVSLLGDIVQFRYEQNQQRIKARWAQQFYATVPKEEHHDS
ncbi:MAG: type I-E CRISPR-associated protein Cse2/CasB [Alphaproteobacteria bacterium]|nr:MAG: type I-E CRISPR-associated protein Cse2/CasB [Alphaproteobacteria bacterium]TAF75311.1 MAG: type I-E CRISPR-associated protein Cse2/CasB [Alphaproteobacteria bacterium]